MTIEYIFEWWHFAIVYGLVTFPIGIYHGRELFKDSYKKNRKYGHTPEDSYLFSLPDLFLIPILAPLYVPFWVLYCVLKLPINFIIFFILCWYDVGELIFTKISAGLIKVLTWGIKLDETDPS